MLRAWCSFHHLMSLCLNLESTRSIPFWEFLWKQSMQVPMLSDVWQDSWEKQVLQEQQFWYALWIDFQGSPNSPDIAHPICCKNINDDEKMNSLTCCLFMMKFFNSTEAMALSSSVCDSSAISLVRVAKNFFCIKRNNLVRIVLYQKSNTANVFLWVQNLLGLHLWSEWFLPHHCFWLLGLYKKLKLRSHSHLPRTLNPFTKERTNFCHLSTYLDFDTPLVIPLNFRRNSCFSGWLIVIN